MDGVINEYKETSRKIFISAYEFYNSLYNFKSPVISNNEIDNIFKHIHAVAEDFEENTLKIENNGKYPLMLILTAYVRAMLKERLLDKYTTEEEIYQGANEKFIWSFIYQYVCAMNPEKTALLRPELIDSIAVPIKDNLFAFRENPLSFNGMCSSLIFENIVLCNRLYQADYLDGLYNRNALNIIWDYRKNATKTIGIIMADGDDFREINNNCGHDEGDNILKIYNYSIMNALKSGYNKYNKAIPARWGGEEFVICIFDCAENDIILLAKEIKDALSTRSEWGSLQEKYKKIKFPRTISQGVVFFNDIRGNEILKDLIGLADVQMYKAKKEGNKDCIYFNGNKIG
jgi:diguanylate cyclase (GGDEF)-like protein